MDQAEKREHVMKLINERTLFKILVERKGILFSVTTKSRAYFFFISSKLIGMRTAPTTDPFPGIVEVSDYDIEKIARNWDTISNIKLSEKLKR